MSIANRDVLIFISDERGARVRENGFDGGKRVDPDNGRRGLHWISLQQGSRGSRFRLVGYDNLSTGHAGFVRWGPLVIGDVRDSAKIAHYGYKQAPRRSFARRTFRNPISSLCQDTLRLSVS